MSSLPNESTNEIPEQYYKDSPNCSYYCSKCHAAFMCVILNDNGSSKPKLVQFKTGMIGRFLQCGHAVNAKDKPLHSTNDGSKVNLDTFNVLPDPNELRQLNITTTLEVSKMTDEQIEQKILHHVEEYKLHLMASKKEKYMVSLLEELVMKQVNDLKATTEEEIAIKRKKELMFGYVFRKPERRLEIQAKDKAREERAATKEIKTEEDAVAKMREFMAKTGLVIGADGKLKKG